MQASERVARNTFFNGLGRVWEAGIALVLVAYIVPRVGIAGYGMWALVGAFTGYAALLDVGLGSGFARFIAAHHAKEDSGQVSAVVSTGVFYYLLFGGVFVAVCWLLIPAVLGLLAQYAGGIWEEAGLRGEIAYLVRGSVLLFAATQCIAPFAATLTGLQRMDVSNGVGVVVSIVKVVATVGFLEMGYGVRGLLYANGVVLAAFGMLSAWAAYRIYPPLRIRPVLARWSTFRELWSYGWRTQVSRLANLVMFETDVLVIAIVLRDLELTGLYRLAVELANKMRQVPGVFLAALLPAASDLDARGDEDRLRRAYLASSRYVAFATIPLAGLVAGSAALMLKAWQGPEFEVGVAAGALQILAVGYVANMIPGAGVAVALGKGRADVQMWAGIISMTANVLLTVGLVYAIGFWGVPLATAVSMAVSWAWFARAMERLVEVPAARILREACVWPIVASVPGVVTCLGLLRLSDSLGSRWEFLLAEAALALVFVVFYMGAIRRLPFFDRADLAFFDATLRLDRVPGYRAWSSALREPS